MSAHPASVGVWKTNLKLGDWQRAHSQVKKNQIMKNLVLSSPFEAFAIFLPARIQQSPSSVSKAQIIPERSPVLLRIRSDNTVIMLLLKVRLDTHRDEAQEKARFSSSTFFLIK